MMKNATYSYQQGLHWGLGKVAPLLIYTTDFNGNYTKESWYYFTDYYGKLQISTSLREWKDYSPGIVLDGIKFLSVEKIPCEGFENFEFHVEWERVE